MSEQDHLLSAFILNGLLFSAYAQQTGSEHVIQPKRSRLLLSIALAADEQAQTQGALESALFARLKDIANEAPDGILRTVEMPGTPTFLPYLLTFGDETPEQLLQRALKLRHETIVQEYRDWWQRTVLEWNQGKRNIERSREVEKLADAIQRRTKLKEDSIQLPLSLTNVQAEKD